MRDSPTVSGLSYRPALDGVRGLAVVAVIVYHLDRDWLPGGYLGVDVFFTLSGFLITTLLILEHEDAGRIGLGRFWSRRARRLLPASLAVIAATAIWLARQDELVRATRRGDLVAALFDVVNWRLIATGESYFEGFAAPSPLRHFWSLAIEEQFYVVWPLLCAVCLPLGLRVLGGVAVVLGAASVVAGLLLYDAGDPSRAYFGTDTRVHQILVGCLLAIGLTRWPARHGRAPSLPSLAGPLAAGSGLVLALGAIFVGDGSVGYYRGGSLIVAVAAALLVLGLEVGDAGPVKWLLTRRPLVATGTISYGLYLWHWPVLVWMPPGTWSLGDGLPIAVARVVVTVAVSLISYVVVERPVREGRLPGLRRPRHVALTSVTAIASVLALVLSVTWNSKVPAWAADSDTPGEVQTAGSGPRKVAVIGDSVAVSLMPGLADEAVARRWTLIGATAAGCPLSGLPQILDDGTRLDERNTDCARDVPSLHAAVIDAGVDVVVWHDLQSSLAILDANGTTVPAGTDEWKSQVIARWHELLAAVRATGAEVVILMPPWRPNRPPDDCRDDELTVRCRELQEQDERIRELTAEFYASVSADGGVHLLELDSRLCPNGRPCPDEVDRLGPRLLGRDRTHFTEEGARWIAPTIADAVDRASDG